MPALLSILPYMKKYRLHSLLPALLMIISAVACRDVNENALVTAENLMMEHPDSALSVLESIDGSCLTGELQARHALLLSQAYDKNYIDLTSDSLISIATDYYEKHGNDRHRLMAYLYKGIVQFNAKDYTNSIVSLTMAENVAQQLNDCFYLGRIYNTMGDLYNATYNSDAQLQCRKLAVEQFDKVADKEYYKWAVLELASAYTDAGEPDKCLDILDSLVGVSGNDSLFAADCMEAAITPLIRTGNYNRAKIVTDSLKKIPSYILSANNNANLVRCYLSSGQLDSALIILNQMKKTAVDNDSMAIKLAWIDYYKSAGDYKSAYGALKNADIYQDSIVRDALRQSVVYAQRDFYNVQSQSAKQKISRVYGYIFIGTIIAVLIVALIVIYAKLRMQLKDRELELNINEIALLTAKISESSCRVDTGADGDELHVIVDRLLARWFAPLNNLFDEYYETGDSASAKSTMFSRVEEELKKITSEKSIKDIVDMVDDSLGGALSRLRNDYTEINDKDITFLALNIAGLSPRAICLFLDIKIKTVYSRRKRLKDKIVVLDTPDKDTLLKYLA